MSRLLPVSLGVIGGLAMLAIAILAHADDPAELRPVIEARYPDVGWIDAITLRAFMGRPPDGGLVLLDSRSEAEFAVSHLRGARRVDPDATDFASLELPPGALVIVYCSVGWRSAAVADRLRRAGVRALNLEGGIFFWANQGLPVYRGRRRVAEVHPFDATWGRYLDRGRRADL
jgi:rhodanese-related sulfurtransferase